MTNQTPALPSPDVLRREWIERLESNVDLQTKNYLRRQEDSYGEIRMCCLGVACDILVKHGIGKWESAGYSNAFRYADPLNEHSETTLTEFVREAFGVGEAGSDVDVKAPPSIAGFVTLTHLNDSYAYTFPQIAKVIRDNFPIPTMVTDNQGKPSGDT